MASGYRHPVLRLGTALIVLAAAALVLTGCFFGGGGGISVYGSIDGYVYYHVDARGSSDAGATKPNMAVTCSAKAPSGYAPLEGARVVAGSRIAYSNSYGYFIVTSLSPGVYDVSITHERFIMGLTFPGVSVVAGRTTHLGDAKLGSFFYLVIGIDDYPEDTPDLNYCVEDAQAMADSLYGRNGYAGEVVLLTDSGATKEGIRAAIQRIGAKMSPNGQDYFVMTFSGHGGSTTDLEEPPQPNPPGVDPPDEFLVASDGELIFDDELTGWIQQYIRIKTNYCLFVFDSCRSGGMIKGVPGTSAPEWMRNFKPGLSRMARNLSQEGYVVLTACDDDEESLECPALQHGVFTYFFCEGIDSTAADADHDNFITGNEVFSYTAPRTTDYADRIYRREQTPQLFAFPPERADIPIYRTQ